ncbi:PIG-L family deacetylase [Candidatus Gottesmanbacteria bacterium]|nr:PIG-L family deacetylase [Candidatus Gottesmanbacteria bacterium]
MDKKILAVFAHPDDEAFGPGGTLARYAAEGTEIHILTATRGEAGLWDENSKLKSQNSNLKIHNIREKELLNSAKILGIKKVEFLDFVDGTLSNSIYHKLADKIIQKIDDFKPQVILTTERLGISGHLDHIAVSMTTTYAYLHSKYAANKLYYDCLTKDRRTKDLNDYFVYFPEGYDKEDVTTVIDFTPYWDKKEAAMKCHQSQFHDVRRILKRWEGRERTDHFILQFHRGINVQLPETDLFAGITH